MPSPPGDALEDWSDNETDTTINMITISPLGNESESPGSRLSSGSPLQSGLAEVQRDIGITKMALDLFLAAKFNEARQLLEPLAATKRSLYGTIGFGVLLVMKAMLTFASEDINEAISYLDDAINIASRMKKGMSASTIYSRLSRIFSQRRRRTDGEGSSSDVSGSDTMVMSEQEVEQIQKHVELVLAEAYLVRALLLVATDSSGGWMLLMRESLNIRSSYVLFHGAFMKLATSSATDIPDVHYESGILLGNGLLNIIFSLLPGRVFQVFSFLGYTASIPIGLSQLRAAAACQEGVRAPLAELILLMYHCVLSDSLAVRRGVMDEGEEGWMITVKSILDRRLAENPNSPIYLYFLARLHVLSNRVDDAAMVLERTLAMKESLEWPQLLHACVWESLAVSMFRLDWDRCYQLARLLTTESKWSLCFSIFLEAIFMAASSYTRDPQPQTREEIFRLLGKVPLMMKRIAGRRLPIEKYANRRAQDALNSGELPFYPEYELLLVWDGFARMDEAHREEVLERIKEAEQGGGMRPEQKEEIMLIRAAVLRSQHRYDEATELLRTILRESDTLPKDSYVIPLAHTEWAQVGIERKDLEMAKHHYELSTTYTHRYILQRSVQLRNTKIKSGIARLSSGN